MEPAEEFTEIESVFVRHRNALLVRGQFTPIYTDYYLHLMQHGLKPPGELDQMLKDMLAMISLHVVARPWSETIAWTANLRAPRVNLFVTAGSKLEFVTGRVFTEGVREPKHSLFYSQTTAPELPEPKTSTLDIEGKDPIAWTTRFYQQSEQRPGRAFRLEDEHFALVAAQPDCDLEWLESLDENAVSSITHSEETKILETRRLRFHCGCNVERVLPALSAYKKRLDELFGNRKSIRIQCPRCAAYYEITRDMLA